MTKEQSPLILDGWNESKHKRDKKGRFAEMEEGKMGTVGSGKGAIHVQLGWGSNRPVFSSDTASKGHDRHHQGHADEMGISLKEWKRRAADLLNAPESNDFLDWYCEETESYSRFNQRDNTLAVEKQNGDIKTYFILQKSRQKFFLPQEYLEKMRRK